MTDARILKIAAELLPCIDEITTSDLQGCVGAEVSKLHLSSEESFELENAVLDYIYSAQETQEPANFGIVADPDEVMRDLFGPVIASYTRAQAIQDGVLIDLATFRLAGLSLVDLQGFNFPVAITSGAYGDLVDGVPDQDRAELTCRVNNLLADLRKAIAGNSGSSLLFFRSHNLALKAICGPGDQAEPVLTVLLPLED
jgi:hypothetical protein